MKSLSGDFPLYAPGSAGPEFKKDEYTYECINLIIPLMSNFASYFKKKFFWVNVKKIPKTRYSFFMTRTFTRVFKTSGSDKSSKHHNYHFFYGAILKRNFNIKNILEIGIGTNNINIVSNMGCRGIPGASLRAFSKLFPLAKVYGADIDKNVLFKSKNIKSYYLDQTKYESYLNLNHKLPKKFDLIIDDGLHSPHANLMALEFALGKIKVGGWIVIEDIANESRPLWEIIANLLPDNFKVYLYTADGGNIFAINKVRIS